MVTWSLLTFAVNANLRNITVNSFESGHGRETEKSVR